MGGHYISQFREFEIHIKIKVSSIQNEQLELWTLPINSGIIPTPPTTPERPKRAPTAEIPPHASGQFSTPTSLGSWLSSRRAAAVDARTTVSLFDFLEQTSFQEAFNEFSSGASESADEEPVRDLAGYLRRILNVGKAFTITCPADLTRYEADRARMFKLMFTQNAQYLPPDLG